MCDTAFAFLFLPTEENQCSIRLCFFLGSHCLYSGPPRICSLLFLEIRSQSSFLSPKVIAISHSIFIEKGDNSLRKCFIRASCSHPQVPILFLSLSYSRVGEDPYSPLMSSVMASPFFKHQSRLTCYFPRAFQKSRLFLVHSLMFFHS